MLPAILLALVPAVAGAQTGPSAEPPIVVTVGEGVVRATPDRAWVSFTAESRADNPQDAQRRNTEAMRPVLDRLRAAGVPEDAIRTTGYELQQEWDYVDGRREPRGYVARNTIEVRLDDIDRIGELIGIAVGAGATEVAGVRFDVQDRAKLEREALRLAVADAASRADAAAAGAGRLIERVLRIESQPIDPGPPMPLQRMSLAQAQEAAGAPPIASGPIEIRARVMLTSVLK
jgi:uncharacterized protein YggE